MRDLSQAPARYTEAQARSATDDGTCNVLDRLPPFQYRYMPSGKVVKPADGRTSLSEGGACHMGRPPRLPNDHDFNISQQMADCQFRLSYSSSSSFLSRGI